MPKSSHDSLNAKGRRDAYMFDPDDLTLITDETSPLYDPRVHLPTDERLVLNLMFQGVLEPITVQRNPDTAKVEVIIGRQRVKAAREANNRLRAQGLEPIRVPAMVARATPTRSLAMLISENELRQDDTPLSRAKKAQRYLDLGRDHAEVAILFGITEQSVKNMLSLLDAPAPIRTAVEAGKISTTDAYKLAKLDPETAKAILEELLTHAPRTPGKKHNPNAAKARKILTGSNGTSKKTEDAVATDIAAWIDSNYEDCAAITKAIRAGKWRTP